MILFSHVFIKELVDKMDEDLVQYYYNNVKKNKYFARPLQDTVKIIMDEQISTISVENITEDLTNVGALQLKSLYSKRMKNRSTKKKRYYKKCKDMYDLKIKDGDDNHYFMWKTLSLYNISAASFDGADFEKLEKERLEMIERWSIDSNTKMIAYPGEEVQTPRSLIVNFEMDVVINILSLIEKEYEFDLNRATYAVVEDFKNDPIFSAVSSKVKKDSLQDGKEGFKEIVINKTPDGTKQMIMEIPVSRFNEKGEFKILDDVDKSILSYLILVWNDKPSNMPVAVAKIRDIIKAVYGIDMNTRKIKRAEIKERIARICEFGMKDYDNGEIKGRTRIISSYKVTGDDEYIHYTIDPIYLDEYNYVRIRKMSSAPLSRLSTKAARILYSAFMEQRRIAYKQSIERGIEPKNYVMPFDYSYFMYWCNFGRMTKAQLQNEITSALDDFIENHIIVQRYKNEPANQRIYIVFDVLTEEEIKDYDFYYDIHQISEKEDDIEQMNLFLPCMD